MNIVDQAASLLISASQRRQPIEPLTSSYPQLTVDDAYQIQLVQLRRKLAGGAKLAGHKIGLTSAAMQRQLGVNVPDFGHLTSHMVHPANEPVLFGEYLQPRVEPEVALVLQRPLRGPGLTVADAAAAVGLVLPALEIIDSRIRDWKISLVDTVADNASSGGVVLGAAATPLPAFDIRLLGCTLHVNGMLAGTGACGAVLGSPLAALAWLANTLGQRGTELEPGQLVMSGAVTAAVPVAPGDTVTAAFAGLGSVTAKFC
jgi:2-keto-4-pentenoate hydratase